MRAAALVLLAAGVAFGQGPDTSAVVETAARVTPSARQLAWQEVEFAAFIHFGMNTFTNREWGEGHEDPALFNPTDFDARQWVDACKQAGMAELILTAKHHDGFCLWPSAYTEHSVKNSPWRDGKGDVVREVADACREGGIRFGVYLSPWDRTERTYGDSPAYNEYFKNQLRELLTNYGAISEVWFDGACGEGPNGKRQEYDWESFYATVRELQPNAVISVCGPDVRWCGNEAGKCRSSEWSVIPASTAAGTPKEGVDAVQVLYGFNPQAEDLGSRDVLAEAVRQGMRLVWYPSQVNTSIRPGWFYHKSDDSKVKSLDHLLDIYYGSVGGNSQLLLNIPPDKRGRIHENDVARLKELGTVLRATFSNNLAQGAKVSASAWQEGHRPELIADGDKNTYWATSDGVTMAELVIEMAAPQTFNRAMLQEYIATGQRLEEFAIEVADANGEWREAARATTVGHKRLLRFDEVTAQRARIRILQSRVSPTLSSFGLFYEPPVVTAPKISRDQAGNVTIEGQPGVELRYWINDSASPSSTSRRYDGPFPLPRGGVVKVVAIPPDGAHCLKAGSLLSEAEFDGGQPQEAAPTEDKKAGWETLQPDPATQTVSRVTDACPLSDQENKAGWKLYEPMTDEFEGTALDSAKWWDHNPGWLGRQPALFYPGNVEVRDGKLNLSMKKEEAPNMPRDKGYHDYTSAAVQSRDTVRYGYFEVKARPMNSAGSSSFWFYKNSDGWWTEIDVFELGARAKGFERKVNITVHVMNTPVTKDHQQIGAAWEAPFDLADDYHVYGLEWDEEELKFYFDGMLVRRGKNTDWHQPLTLNFDSETMPEWFGLPEDKDLPSTFSVEYVRVWKKG